jgi:hypothetical protein
MGCCEPEVQWSLQGKKSPVRRFFDVDCAKRNKLLDGSVLSKRGIAVLRQSLFLSIVHRLRRKTAKRFCFWSFALQNSTPGYNSPPAKLEVLAAQGIGGVRGHRRCHAATA